MFRLAIIGIPVFFALTGCISTSGTPEGPEDPEDSLAEYQTEMFDALDEARLTPRFCGSAYFVSADPLVYDLRLRQASEEHAWDMASNDFVSKIGSNGSVLEGRLGDTLYEYDNVGEIAYGGSSDVEEVVQNWISDPLRCATLMQADFTNFAVTRVESETGRFPAYWSVVFASAP